MIWIQHDFYNNFVKSIETGDIDLSLDIFRSELSDLLTYKSNDLFGLFSKLKIKYNKKQSYQELVDIIINQIKTNQKFVRGLSFLIGESNKVVKKSDSWQKLLNNITNGINVIAKYFIDNPKRENLFKKQMKDMIGLKSSVTGNDKRDLEKKDNTVLWIIGIAAVCVAGYFVYRYFDKKKQERLRLESLNPKKPLDVIPDISEISNANIQPPNQVQAPIDPSYIVPNDVLLPETQIPTTPSNAGVQINVSTNPNPTSPTPNIAVPQMPTL